MSADDGWLVRKARDEGYVVHHYTASADEYPAVDDGRGAHFQDLEAAIVYANRRDLAWPTEYGVRVILLEEKLPQFLCSDCLPVILEAQNRFVKIRSLSSDGRVRNCRCGKQTTCLVEPLEE